MIEKCHARITLDNNKRKASTHALLGGHYDIFQYLIKHCKGAEGDICGSVFMDAIYGGNLDAVRYLVQHGVNPNQKAKDGRTAVEAAACKPNSNIFKYLISECGANLNVEASKHPILVCCILGPVIWMPRGPFALLMIQRLRPVQGRDGPHSTERRIADSRLWDTSPDLHHGLCPTHSLNDGNHHGQDNTWRNRRIVGRRMAGNP